MKVLITRNAELEAEVVRLRAELADCRAMLAGKSPERSAFEDALLNAGRLKDETIPRLQREATQLVSDIARAWSEFEASIETEPADPTA